MEGDEDGCNREAQRLILIQGMYSCHTEAYLTHAASIQHTAYFAKRIQAAEYAVWKKGMYATTA